MKSITAEVLFKAANDLGEGPVWHPAQGCLYWVDIEAGDLYRSNPELISYSKTHFDFPVGAFCFSKSGEMILATGKGFMTWGGVGEQPDLLWNPLPERAGVRLNDGKVDPAGRFWAGSIDTEKVEGQLFRLDPGGARQILLDGIGISNGLGWSPDHQIMYYTDSYRYTIFAFDYDPQTGAIQNQRPFIQLPKTSAEIVPDGLCVDAEGCIWSAQWNGWQVVRYDPHGNPLMSIKVPAQRVTSCCFGGESGDLLFITTARTGLSKTEMTNQPEAGSVFVIQTNTCGLGTHFFG